jgi:hypothetical protein
VGEPPDAITCFVDRKVSRDSEREESGESQDRGRKHGGGCSSAVQHADESLIWPVRDEDREATEQ